MTKLRPSLPPQPPDPESAEPEQPEHLRSDLKSITVYLPIDLHWQLKQEALDRSREGKSVVSVSKLIVEALRGRARFSDH